MKKLLFCASIFFLLFSSDNYYDESLEEQLFEEEQYVDKLVSDLKETLLQKGVKILSSELPDRQEISTNELVIDLKNPKFSHGILTTHEGGVIRNSDLRIQAKTIQYIKRTENGELVHRIEADGDLMMIYKDRVFVGDELEYDFVNKKGVIYSGKTYAAPWYLGGDEITLDSDGSYKIKNVFLTTCENINSSWDIHASTVEVEKKELLRAKRVRFRFFKFPAIWFPSLKLNLKKFLSKPIIKYKVNWDKASGPRASIRYQAYSWKDFLTFLRLDYRLKMGFGGAVETEYFPPHKRTSFVTRSYLAQDIVEKELKDKRRYRLQGAYRGKSLDGKTTGFITWDKYSDIRMPSDFKSDDFEVDTAKKTELKLRHERHDLIAILHSRAKANDFETIKQDLPTVYTHFHPVHFKTTGIISNNWAKVSYLDYSYSDDLSIHLKDINSFRAEARNELYRPIHFKGFTLTPKIGLLSIAYGDSPQNEAKGLMSFMYGGKAQSDIFKKYKKHKHILRPYVEYIGYTDPNLHPDRHYIFSIEDGFDRINMLKTGVLNEVYSLKITKGKPTFKIDTYTNLFFGLKEIHKTAPRGYLDFEWNLPTVFLSGKNAWNFNRNVLDYTNLRLGWTASKNVALALEFRYRSKYDWRKSDHDNYILNVTRDEYELLTSPLSDRRCTFLSHLFIRINPFLTFHIESHHGWNRRYGWNAAKHKHYKEKSYNEFKIDLYTMVSRSWKIKISYTHTETDDRFSFDYFLLKF